MVYNRPGTLTTPGLIIFMSDELTPISPDFYAFRAIEQVEKRVKLLEEAMAGLLLELSDEAVLTKEFRLKLITLFKSK